MLPLGKGESGKHTATQVHWDSEILLGRLKWNPEPEKAMFLNEILVLQGFTGRASGGPCLCP